MLSVDKDSNLIPFLSSSDYVYTTTLSTLAMGNHLLFEIEDFVPRTGVEPVRPIRNTRF